MSALLDSDERANIALKQWAGKSFKDSPTPQELKEAVDAICIAQAQHLLKLLAEPCKEHPLPFKTRTIQCHLVGDGNYYADYRCDCPACMAEIHGEVFE